MRAGGNFAEHARAATAKTCPRAFGREQGLLCVGGADRHWISQKRRIRLEKDYNLYYTYFYLKSTRSQRTKTYRSAAHPPAPVGPPVTLSLGKVIPPSSVARSAAHWSQNCGSEGKRDVAHVGEQ